jgi:hypothetical protein
MSAPNPMGGEKIELPEIIASPESPESNLETVKDVRIVEKFEEIITTPAQKLELQDKAVAAAKAAGIEIDDNDVEAKKEKIISKLVEAVLAAGDDDDAERKIMEKAMAYTGKGYPMIADAVHDRILEERNRGM